MSLSFGPDSPFDANEQRVVFSVFEAVRRDAASAVLAAVRRLETLSEAICAFAAEGIPDSTGRTQTLDDLLRRLLEADPISFELCVPTRALLSRDLIMGEVNFYRFLRSIDDDARVGVDLIQEIDDCLCRSLHSRLALEVLEHIVSDHRVERAIRSEAAASLWRMWGDPAYRLSEFFPALAATWNARCRVPVVLGTLMGTAELYQLIGAGCDTGFVDWLIRPDQPEEQSEAFREFLFGTTTEELARIEQRMSSDGRASITRADLAEDEQPHDACATGDPATALFDFFLSRHLQADARRRMRLPGPSRTAEEYVMLHVLEERLAERRA